MNRIILLIRRTSHWYFERTPDLDGNEVLHQTNVESIHDKGHFCLEVLGKTFADLRTEISDIACSHNLSHKIDVIYNYAYDRFPIDSNAWIFPIDEDDLIDQHSLELIRQHRDDTKRIGWKKRLMGQKANVVKGIGWKTWVIDQQTNSIRVSTERAMPSNSYALLGEVGVENFRLVMRHGMVRKELPHSLSRFDLVSGMKVQTPLSIGKLREIKDVDDFARRVREFKAVDSSILPIELRTLFQGIQEVFPTP